MQTRELHWQVDEDRGSIRELEIQIWNERGELLKREVLFFADGAPAEIVQKVPLADGDCLVRTFVKRAAQPVSEQYAQTIHVSGNGIVLRLQGSNEPH